MLSKITSRKFCHFYPNMVCVVVSSFQGRTNGMPAAWTTGVSSSPRRFSIMISRKRYTYEIISKSRKFSVNFLDWKHLDIVVNLGSCSGREMDKMKRFGIPLEKGELEGVFYIPLAYAVYECELVMDKEVGDHNILVGEVVNVLVDREVFDENERPILGKVNPIFYLGNGEYVKLAVSERYEEE